MSAITRRAGRLLSVLLLAATGLGANAATMPDGRGDAILLAADERSDFDLGYRDGYHNMPYRDRDRSNASYGEGYRAGESRRQGGSGSSAGSGSDYDTGYRDGFHNLPYRDRDRSNDAYGKGFRAGEAQRRSGGGKGNASPDYDLGYRDGYRNQAYRDKDRSNRAYGEGYRAGKERRVQGGGQGGGAAINGDKDYKLGYDDGRNRRAYRDKDRSNQSYGRGYRAGQADQNAMGTGSTPQRPTSALGNPLPRPTNARATVGRPAAFLNEDMAALGYRSLGELKQRGQVVTLWRGTSDSDCFRISLAGGRVKDVFQMSETECR